MSNTKQCARCKITQSKTNFTKLTRSKDGLAHQCKSCNALKAKLDRKNNPEKFRLRSKEYRESHKEQMLIWKEKNKNKMKEYFIQYGIDNKEERNAKAKARRDTPENKAKAKEYGKKYWQKHKDKLHKQNRQRDLDNPERTKAYKKKYKKSDKGKISGANCGHKRRFIKMATANGSIPIAIQYPHTKALRDMLTTQKDKCVMCNCEISHEEGNIHLDHIIPLSKGGTHTIDNVQWLCANCNMNKGSKILGVSEVNLRQT